MKIHTLHKITFGDGRNSQNPSTEPKSTGSGSTPYDSENRDPESGSASKPIAHQNKQAVFNLLQ